MKEDLGGGFKYGMFYFHPDPWGRWTHFDEHSFQMGWFNHHLEIYLSELVDFKYQVHPLQKSKSKRRLDEIPTPS